MENNLPVLYIEGKRNDNLVEIPPSSMIALFTLQYCQNCFCKLVFVDTTSKNKEFDISSEFGQLQMSGDVLFPIDISKIKLQNYFFEDINNCPGMIKNCTLPALLEDEQWCVAGLCSSLRFILKRTVEINPQHFCRELLGFRNGCLQACAEVSVWTKFCEIETINTLTNLFSQKCFSKAGFELPLDLLRYEEHLKRPPILHNALKQKQNQIRKLVKDKDQRQELMKKKLSNLPNLEHSFAEGLTLTLADIILFSSFHLIICYIKPIYKIKEVCPLLIKWYNMLSEIDNIKAAICLFHGVTDSFVSIEKTNVIIPAVPNESLYKSDPDRYKPRWRAFTHQSAIDNVLSKVNKCGTNPNYANLNDEEYSLTWSEFPAEINPQGGDLPLSRVKRKQQQLENMCHAVKSQAKDNDIIVEFCAGGGHLGILLAYCLPTCKILLIENKEASLERAKERVNSLCLKNITFYQCNLDYFIGDFDIGVSLHACGVATDLTMQKCYEASATFIACPCCYGAVQPNHILSYPRSKVYANAIDLKIEEYLTLGHAADQTHDEENPKTQQGRQCMRLIDHDRLLLANELGYITKLFQMKPPTCSPKNHILIGSFVSNKNK